MNRKVISCRCNIKYGVEDEEENYINEGTSTGIE
jgi:hypothetical protein